MPDPTPPEPDDSAAAEAPAAPDSPATPAPPAAPPAVATPPALALPPAPKTEGLAVLREWTTTIIAGVILLLTVAMMWSTFKAAGGDFERMKDVLLYALPLLGTILGYYFGRVPAERRAEASEQKAGAAQAQAQAATTQSIQTQNETDEKLQKVRVGLERVKAKAEVENASADAPGGVLGGEARGGGSYRVAGASSSLAELDALSKIL